MTAPEEHHVRFLCADFGHQRVKVFLPAGQPFVHHLLNAAFRQRRFSGIRQPLTVGVFIVDDDHPFGFQLIKNKIAGDLALLVVTSAHAKYVAHATFGNQWVR